ncbi:DEAD/DEAH box helicase, partial [Clostridioides difficile]|nr:DEAD/DEAH box helicase [Clostridioides difficile]
MNEIFIIEKKQVQNCTVLESIFFYKNINPNTVQKRIRVNKIERYISIDDIKKDLELDKEDKSLERAIKHTKDRMLNSLDEEEKLLLLKG